MNWKQIYSYTEKQIRNYLRFTYGDRKYRITELFGRKAVLVSNDAQVMYYEYKNGHVIPYFGDIVDYGVPGYTFAGYVSDIALDIDREQPEVREWMFK